MFKKFLSLLLVWSLLCTMLISFMLIPAYAQGERAGIYSCNLPSPNYGMIRATGTAREVYGLDKPLALAIWNMKGIAAHYSRAEWSHYYSAQLTAISVNNLTLSYSVYFASLRDNPYFLYVFIHRIDDRGVIYDNPCSTFVIDRDYLDTILTALRSN